MSRTDTSTDPSLVANQPLATQELINPQAIEWLLVVLANDPGFFQEARNLMAPHHFQPGELPLRLAYEAIEYCYTHYEHPTFEAATEFVNQLVTGPTPQFQLTLEQSSILFQPDPNGLLFSICEPNMEFTTGHVNFARDLLRRFSNERTVVMPLRQVLNPNLSAGVPNSEMLANFLDVINHQQARLSTTSVMPVVEMAPAIGTELVPSSVFNPTGVDFIDRLIGGQRVGDCNGILGPTGGGKTTLGVYMACQTAKQCWNDWIAAGQPDEGPDVVVFVTVEEAAIKLRPRIWSSFCKIPKETVDTLTDWEQFSQPGNLRQYELDFQADNEHKLSEIERYRAYSPQMSRCLKVIDMSGSEEFPNAGNGYVPEIVAYLTRMGHNVRQVVIDYAGLLCERYMASQGMDESGYRRLLKNCGDVCRQQISERFGCTTWLLHQVKGQMGTVSPTKLIHHSDASESKDFAENMAHCLCLGVADKNGIRRLNISKCRTRPNEAITPPILRITPYASIEDVTEVYTVNSASREFVTISENSQIAGTEQAQRVSQAGPTNMRNTNEPQPMTDPIQSSDAQDLGL